MHQHACLPLKHFFFVEKRIFDDRQMIFISEACILPNDFSIRVPSVRRGTIRSRQNRVQKGTDCQDSGGTDCCEVGGHSCVHRHVRLSLKNIQESRHLIKRIHKIDRELKIEVADGFVFHKFQVSKE